MARQLLNLHHHDHQSVTGNAIPLGASIMSVADAFSGRGGLEINFGGDYYGDVFMYPASQ
ncbi:hypothetical protein ACFLRP_01325 [Bacteroidota bacterium]